MLKSIEERDSDGDGFTNAEEFAADTLPGDTVSHPAGAPKAKAGSGAGATSAPEAGELSPFDVKAALLAKHAQHPILIHFPIALFVIGLLFDVAALKRRDASLAKAGYFNLSIATITSVFAVVTGILAWQWQFGGMALSDSRNLLLHLVLGITTAVLLIALWAIRRPLEARSEQYLPSVYWILAVIVLVVISLEGHIGGILSGVVK